MTTEASRSTDTPPLVDPKLAPQLQRLETAIRRSIRVATACVGCGLLIAAWGVYWFDNNAEALDRLGGFLAGTTGVLWALAGLFLIFVAFQGQQRQTLNQEEEIRLTREELRQTREELHGQKVQLEEQSRTFRQQRFENTFFQMLQLHHVIVNSVDVTEAPSLRWLTRRADQREQLAVFSSRDAFAELYRRLSERYANRKHEQGPLSASDAVQLVYEPLYNEHQSDLGHYFRHLYSTVRVIKESDAESKLLYTSILRAQLSAPEMLLLFYNGLSVYGRDRFKPLIEEFHLLNNMPQGKVLNPEHLLAYSPLAYADTRQESGPETP